VIINLRDTPKPEMRSILRMLDTLERLGCNIDLPAARKVRKLAKRHGEIAAEKRTEAGSAADIQTATARDLAAGKISAGDVRSAAVAATLSADGASTLHKIYDRALAILSRQARDHLAELGDRWITDVLRPVVDQTAARILADIPANMAPAIRPRDPDSEALVAGRLDAQVAHTQLRELHGVAHQLRVLRCIPATPRDVTCWTPPWPGSSTPPTTGQRPASTPRPKQQQSKKRTRPGKSTPSHSRPPGDVSPPACTAERNTMTTTLVQYLRSIGTARPGEVRRVRLEHAERLINDGRAILVDNNGDEPTA
jgi:hypothetical protein